MHIFILEYLKEEGPYFIEVSNMGLIAQSDEDTLNIIFTDFKKEVIRKKNKYATKKKKGLRNFMLYPI